MMRYMNETHWVGRCRLRSLAPDAVIERADSAFWQVTGYAAQGDAPQGLTLDALIHPQDREAFWRQAAAQWTAEGLLVFEHRIVSANRHVRYAGTIALPALEGSGVDIALVALADVPYVRKKAESVLGQVPCGLTWYTFADEDKSEGVLRYANQRFYELIGHTPESFATEHSGLLLYLASESDRRYVLGKRNEALQNEGSPVQATFAIQRPDGGTVALLCGVVNIGAPSGPYEVLITCQDVTALSEIQKDLTRQNERIGLIARAIHERFLEYDVPTDTLTLLSINRKDAVSDVTIAGCLGENRLAEYVHPEDAPRMLETLRRLCGQGENGRIDLRTSLVAGEAMRWHRFDYTCVRDAQGRVAKVILRGTNIDSEKQHELTLQQRAERDNLTGLYSRGATEQMVERFLHHENDMQSGQRHALMMIDLDNFKQINDSFSHSFGDVVLRDIAGILRESFRASDIAGRFGGDEFLVLMKNYRDKSHLQQVAERLCTSIQRKYQTALDEIELSASVGIACYPEHGTTLSTLYENADIANHEAKREGKNRYRIYQKGASASYQSDRTQAEGGEESLQKDMEESLLSTLHLENDPRKAIIAALGTMGRHFNTQHAYIIEFGPDGVLQPVQYMWTAPGYAFDPGMLPEPPMDALFQFSHQFDYRGLRIVPDTDELGDPLRPYFQAMGAKAMLHYAYRSGGTIVGYIGMDDCVTAGRTPSPKLLSELSGVSRLLTLFLQARTPVDKTAALIATTGLLDGLEDCAYLIDSQTHEMVFINRQLMNRINGPWIGGICYELLHGRSEPCEQCMMRTLRDTPGRESAMCEMYISRLDMYAKLFGAWFDIGKKEKYFLVQCIDVTKYRKGNTQEEAND